jgi:hypothetical protein
MSVWGTCSGTCLGEIGSAVGGLAGVVLLGLAAMLGAAWSRAQIGRRFDRRIAQVYEVIRTKAEAARGADYGEVPAEAFALYHALRDEFFELAGLGGAMQALKDAVVRAAAQPTASSMAQTNPVKGAVASARMPPSDSIPPNAVTPDPHAELKRAVHEFCDYWSNRQKVERQLRQVVRNLGGELVVPEEPARRKVLFWRRLNPAGSRPRASSPARPRSRPASP